MTWTLAGDTKGNTMPDRRRHTPFWLRHPVRAFVYRRFVRAGKRGAEALRCIGVTEHYNPETATTHTPYGLAVLILEAAHPKAARL